MSDIEVVTALPAAASPSHPDHPRWVKDQMLRREVEWLRKLGINISTTSSEAHVDEGMRRLYARKRDNKQVVRAARRTGRDPDRNVGHALAREAGYGFRQRDAGRVRDPAPVKHAAPAWECGRCGTCVRCKRELRSMNILRMGRAGDEQLRPLALRIVSACVAANARIGLFEGLTPHDVNRVLTRIIEDVCDKSTAIAGPWR